MSMMALAPASVASLPKSHAQDPTHTRSRRALALPAPRDASNVLKKAKNGARATGLPARPLARFYAGGACYGVRLRGS